VIAAGVAGYKMSLTGPVRSGHFLVNGRFSFKKFKWGKRAGINTSSLTLVVFVGMTGAGLLERRIHIFEFF
jgi:hypothetical protein